ncbi:MAG TPA: hypothetical protein VIK18_12720 [Pirellulales bacterium]
MEKQPFGQQPIDKPAPLPGHQLQPDTALVEADVTVFAEWMDAELEKLVARWIHLAAPRAGRSSHGRGLGI